MADSRYLEAWKRNPQSVPKATSSATTKSTSTTAQPSSSLNVRLDTPGGVTYSPSEMTSHNLIKRLFIPYKLGEGGDDRDDNDDREEYDFDGDLKREENRTTTRGEEGKEEEKEEEEGDEKVSAARAYALSINFDALEEKRQSVRNNEKLSSRVDEEGEERSTDDYGYYNNDYDYDDKKTISGQSKMSTSSKMTTATMVSMSSKKQDGSLPDWFTRTSANKDAVPFIVPPSRTGLWQDYKRPWDAMKWHGHRAFERPSERERERGIAAFEDVNGIGRAPSIAETRVGSSSDDSRSIMSTQTSTTTRQAARSLNVADLFVVDPRKSRPLRMVRRTDPRQVLLLCNGVYLGPSQVTSFKVAQAAQKAGLDLKTMSNNSKEAQKMLSSFASSATSRGGIGVVYCPHEDALSQDSDRLATIDPRIDINPAKRLEVPPTFTELTERRAQLRAVLAALELANWEEEGFDKVVIGVEQNWIVRGISNDIWRWKHTGWTLTEEGPQGSPGDSVPDRDLWELLDQAIQSYEKIDCNVRFWQVSSKDARLAKNLAEVGAMKDVQRPMLVRWRRKKPSVLQAAEKSKKDNNHQGPVLSQVQ